jgi:hypothetical protein
MRQALGPRVGVLAGVVLVGELISGLGVALPGSGAGRVEVGERVGGEEVALETRLGAGKVVGRKEAVGFSVSFSMGVVQAASRHAHRRRYSHFFIGDYDTTGEQCIPGWEGFFRVFIRMNQSLAKNGEGIISTGR